MTGRNDARHCVRLSRECVDCGGLTWKPGAHKCSGCIKEDKCMHAGISRHPSRKGNPDRCLQCEGMPWRRPEKTACKCGKLYRPEDVPRLWG